MTGWQHSFAKPTKFEYQDTDKTTINFDD